MAKSSYRKALSSKPPATTEAGAAHVREFIIKLYDRQDGQGADWKLVAETLFRASFDILDKLPDDDCRMVARRVHEGAYGRMAEGPKASPTATKAGVAAAELAPSNTTDFKA